jgi:transposase
VNNRDKNFTPAKVKRRLSDIETSIERYLSKLDAADRNEPALPPAKVSHLHERIIKLKERLEELKAIEIKVQNAPDAQVSLTLCPAGDAKRRREGDPDARSMLYRGGIGAAALSATTYKQPLMLSII